MTNLQAVIIGAAIVAAAGFHGALVGGRYVPIGSERMLDTLTGNLRLAGRDAIRADLQSVHDKKASVDREALELSYCSGTQMDTHTCREAFDRIEKKRFQAESN